MHESTVVGICTLVGVVVGAALPIIFVEVRDWWKKKRDTYWSD